MNKDIFITLGVVALVGVGAIFFMMSGDPQTSKLSIVDEIDDGAMVKVDDTVTADVMVKKSGQENVNQAYVNYSSDYLEKYSSKTKVLFFHANWCPTCKQADLDINQNLAKLPDNVVILKTDYDSESELKSKYNITYQHTFVLVDDQGNEIKKWNGGSVDEIIDNLN